MLAWNSKRWIGAVVLVSGLVWFVFARHSSLEGVIGGIAAAFAVITARLIPALWPRLQAMHRIYLILATTGLLWVLLFTANRNQNARVVSTSLETVGLVVIFGLYWPFSKAMDALWLWFRRHQAK